MAIYIVMEPPRRRADSDPVYVRDGFSWIGFLLPIIWLLWNRLWLETIVFLAVSLALGLLGERAGVAEFTIAGLSILLSTYVGFEGAVLRLWALRRRGWTEWGVVEAEDRLDAEARYVSETVAEPSVAVVPVPIRPASAPPPQVGTGAPELGLFGYPGRS